MSAGVSDQRMKGQGNQVTSSSNKNVESEERTSIPWSQQVDEASFENLSSPTEGSQSGCYESPTTGGTKFQYPPFNVKEGNWSSGKSSRRISSNNYENEGGYGQKSSYNYFQKNGDYGSSSSWNSQMNSSQSYHQRRTNNYDEFRSDRNSSNQNDTYKSVQRGVQNISLENSNISSTRSSTSVSNDTNTANNSKATAPSATKTETSVASVPKKMTWASIASQPAKPTLRTTSSSSTLKKKGPGMPPPPMVPGKHNMDIGTWDSPKNGPVLVPPPPPPVIPVPIMEQHPNQSKSNSSSSQTNVGRSSSKEDVTTQNAAVQQQRQQQKHTESSNQSNQNSNNQSSTSTGNVNQHVRPPWKSQNNPPPNTRNVHLSQNTRGGGGSGNGPNQGPPFDYQGSGRHHHQQQQQLQQQPHHHPMQQQTQFNRPPQTVSSNINCVPATSGTHPLLEALKGKNNYNPNELNYDQVSKARFFVIKSFSEDDVHRSIKYGIWCSTDHGNKRLDDAFREREQEKGSVFLFFSVNASGHFCGVAHMLTPVDYNAVSSVWSSDMWKGMFKVKWIYVKDVPNSELRHIRLENNENKSVTASRDAQEVPFPQGQQVLKIIHSYNNTTSIFDDFFHYEKKQEEEYSKKTVESPPQRDGNVSPGKMHRGNGDYERNYDKGFHGGGGGGFRDRNFGRGGGYHNSDNRRNDDYRGFDRSTVRDRDQDGPPPPSGFYGSNRDGGDFHNNRGSGFNRGDYNRRDMGRNHSNYNNRDRDREFHSGESGNSFMNRGDNNRSGNMSFRDSYNRDRDHFSRGPRNGPRDGLRDGPPREGLRDGPPREGPRDGQRDGLREGPRDGPAPRETLREGSREGIRSITGNRN